MKKSKEKKLERMSDHGLMTLAGFKLPEADRALSRTSMLNGFLNRSSSTFISVRQWRHVRRLVHPGAPPALPGPLRDGAPVPAQGRGAAQVPGQALHRNDGESRREKMQGPHSRTADKNKELS